MNLVRHGTVPEDKKTGFYAKVLDEAEQLEFESAAGMNGIDDEIAIIRIKIRAILEHDPDNIQLLMAAAERLTKMVKVQYKLNEKQHNRLKEGITNIIKDIAVPAGIAILKDKIG